MLKKLLFYLSNRFILVLLMLGVFLIVNIIYTHTLLPGTSTRDFWFYSGLLMLLFSILFIEPFYTSPKNIITNSLPLILSYLAIHDEFKDSTLWLWTFVFLIICFLFSIVSIALQSENESQENLNNRISNFIRKYVSIVGNGKIIYSIVFISVIFLYKSELDLEYGYHYFMVMIIIWGFILAINPKSLHSKFSTSSIQLNTNSIGTIFSVQSNNMFLAKLFDDKNNIQKFDLVEFRYSFEEDQKMVNQGIVFDTFKLNSEKWAKIICLDSTSVEKPNELKKNVVYKTNNESSKYLLTQLNIDNFVGVIVQGSRIGTIKFEYSKKVDNIQEGDLIELKSQGKRIFYQVLNGLTECEHLESKNESGIILGDAIQLGIWNNENLSFEKFGWTPMINTPIFLANTSDFETKTFELPEFQLGVIPNTTLPSIIDLNVAVSHHTALLGVTGAGKSFLSVEIIKNLIKDTNVICVDFTGEYKKDLVKLAPTDIIKVEGLTTLETKFAEKHQLALAKKPAEELALRRDIQVKLSEYIEEFIKSDTNIGLFELPALSNTSFILEFTQYFFECVFNYAKANPGQKICLVLEEAHTIVPETGFLGDLGDYGSTKALVNKMSQIALQGRKYGVGLLVIAQRTANVSKTVLTQCNTIICFQAFDETSFTFLGNYIGKDLVQSLPNLKKYHAIVSGKAIKSNIPMIVNLERENLKS
jgi:hypothetical protein